MVESWKAARRSVPRPKDSPLDVLECRGFLSTEQTLLGVVHADKRVDLRGMSKSSLRAGHAVTCTDTDAIKTRSREVTTSHIVTLLSDIPLLLHTPCSYRGQKIGCISQGSLSSLLAQNICIFSVPFLFLRLPGTYRGFYLKNN
jgi:hypothetical protein